jgi:WD40 repeat protein
MRSDASVLEAVSSLPETGSMSGRTACTRFRFWNRRRVGLLLAFAILLAWLPVPRPVPENRPPRRARGISGDSIVRLAFSPDGQSVATTDELGRVRLRPAAGGRCIERDLGARGQGRVVVFSRDGRFLMLGGSAPDIVVCDLTGVCPDRLLGIPVADTSDLKVSPDGRVLAVSNYRSGAIILWDLASGRERMTLRGHSSRVDCLAFAADGRSLASAAVDDESILIWDLATGRPRRRLTPPVSYLLTLAYSPDGRLLASASATEKCVRIWDVRGGDPYRLIAGHSFPTRSVAFSPDGSLLATASGDGTAGLWSVATGRELRRLDGQADLLRNIAFSPDGRMLAATGNDDDVRLWDVAGLIGDRPDRR